MTETRVTQEYSVTVPAAVSVSNIRGDIRVVPHDEPLIRLLAVREDNSGDSRGTVIHVEQREDGTVLARTEHESGWFGFSRPCRVHYTIQAPRETSVRTRNVSGSTRVEGMEGRHKFKSVSGSLTLEDLSGEIVASVVSGSIRAQRLHGPAELNSVSGGIEVADSDLPTLQASAVSGTVHVQTPLGEGPYRFSTVSGSIRLEVGEGQGCHVHARTVSGHIRTNLHATRGVVDRRFWDVDLNGGGPVVSLTATSGSLTLLAAGAGEPGPVRFRERTSEERISVLTRLENGELSVEEALKQL
jgi:hypothetical protein